MSVAEPETPEQDQAEERRALRRVEAKDWKCAYAVIPRFALFSRPKPDGRYPIVDLHRSGAQILCAEELKRGQKILMAMAKEGQKAFRIEGEVVWTGPGKDLHPYRMGVHFTNYRREGWKRLQDLEGE